MMAKVPKQVEVVTHTTAKRKNIPTAELQTFLDPAEDARTFQPVHYPRARPLAEGETRARDADLDPQLIWNGVRVRLTPDQVQQLTETGEVALGDAQLVWRGKDTQDWSDLIVQAPPLYIQEKVHPKAIIDDLQRHQASATGGAGTQIDLFGDFNGVPPDARTEFYQHDAHWSNRMILGDSLQVMASLAEREGLRGKVQCIYFDPPYGIKFNSNWQVSTQSRDVKDGKQEDISREPEQVKAFRDTWKDGIHSYLTYLRDRLTVARELLTDSGSIFVQIGDENVHRVRAVMDEVFGAENFISLITVAKTAGATADYLAGITDYVLWSARSKQRLKYRPLYQLKEVGGSGGGQYTSVQEPTLIRRRLSRGEIERPSILPLLNLEWVTQCSARSCPLIAWRPTMFGAIPLSRPKPPQAVAEGQPLQGDSPEHTMGHQAQRAACAVAYPATLPPPDQREVRTLPTQDSKEPQS